MKYIKVSQDWIIFTGITCVNFIQFRWKYTHLKENFMIYNFDCDIFFEKMHNYVVNWWNTVKYMKVAQDWIILTGITCVNLIQLRWKYTHSNENIMIFNFDWHIFTQLCSRRVILCLVMVYVRLFVHSFLPSYNSGY